MTEIMKLALVFITCVISMIKPKYGIGIVVFLLPFASRYIIIGDTWISLLVFMVIALLGGLLVNIGLLQKYRINNKEIKLANKEVIILFLLSMLISFIRYMYHGTSG